MKFAILPLHLLIEIGCKLIIAPALSSIFIVESNLQPSASSTFME